MPVSATSISETQKKGEQLEEQKKAAEAEKSSLDNELNTVIQELQKAQDDMSAKEEQIESAENELVEAKVTENNQYESMKKRIKCTRMEMWNLSRSFSVQKISQIFSTKRNM